MTQQLFPFATVALLSTSLFVSCSSDSPENQINNPDKETIVENSDPIPHTPFDLDVTQRKAASGYWNFSMRLLDKVGSGKDDNVIISPLSLSMVLSMIANGATYDAAMEIAGTLGVESVADLNSLNELLIREYPKADNQVKFSLANSLWIDKDLKLKKEFTSLLTDKYDAESFSRNLQAQSTMNDVNSWVNVKTMGMIPDFLEEPFSANARLVLINTGYFKGDWSKPFESNNTYNQPFKSANGSSQEVSTMHRNADMTYTLSHAYHSVTLDYGNSAFNMSIFLPLDGFDMDDMLNALMKGDESTTESRYVKLSLPRFKEEYKVDDYKTFLSEMGIDDIFTDERSLAGISDHALMVSRILQKTVIAVDEKGTEAAAATSADFIESAGDFSEKPGTVRFTVDRPFLFMIRESSSGCVLFAGIIRNL